MIFSAYQYPRRVFAVLFLLLWMLWALPLSRAQAQTEPDSSPGSRYVGKWVINDDLSENTDDRVEAAIKAAGGKVKRRLFSKRPEDFYRGGPEEQELYDRLSYDDVLSIQFHDNEFRFVYADDFTRVFYTDGRTRSTAVNDYFRHGGADYSFANFEGDILLVESRPRDGGFTEETYTLAAEGRQLKVELLIKPNSFGVPIELMRVYDLAP